MADRLHLEPKHRRILQALLREYLPGVEVWAYGSRVNGRSHEGSDLDLVLRGRELTEIPSGQLGDFEEAVHESSIPFLVEARDWTRLPERFHREIERNYAVLTSTSAEPGVYDWQKSRWGDIATLEYGRALRGYDTAQGAFRVFGTNGPIGWHNQPLCEHASVIVGRKGAYRGIHYSSDPFFVIDTAFYLKPKVEIDARWAYYTLLTQDINGMDSGSAIPSTSRDEFYNLPVLVPPLCQQHTIACVLGTLDDKIEFNRRMNETLETMARALFKSWFVDFDPVRAKMEGRDPGLPRDLAELFPDRFVDSELGEIPEGWAIYRLDELAEHHALSVTPSARPETTFEYFSIPAHDGDRTPAMACGKSIKSNKTIVPPNSVLLSKLNPDIPRVWMPGAGDGGPQICSTEFMVFIALGPANRSLLFCLFMSTAFCDMLQSMVTGTSKSHQRVPPAALKRLDVLSGTPALFHRFSRSAAPMLDRVAENRVESQALAALRDTLLPKLISGDLRVNAPDPVFELPVQ